MLKFLPTAMCQLSAIFRDPDRDSWSDENPGEEIIFLSHRIIEPPESEDTPPLNNYPISGAEFPSTACIGSFTQITITLT
jgi:hypothetical protein